MRLLSYEHKTLVVRRSKRNNLSRRRTVDWSFAKRRPVLRTIWNAEASGEYERSHVTSTALFHVKHSPVDIEFRAAGVDQRECLFITESGCLLVLTTAPRSPRGRPLLASLAEQHQPTPIRQKLGSDLEEHCISAYRADGHELRRRATSIAGNEIFESLVLDGCPIEREAANTLAEERRFACLRFDHRELQGRTGQLQRDCWRPAAGAQIEPDERLVSNVSRRRKRLHEQPVERFVCRRIEWERRKVDLHIPAGEQCEVGFERLDEDRRRGDIRATRASGQPIAKLAGSHLAETTTSCAAAEEARYTAAVDDRRPT